MEKEVNYEEVIDDEYQFPVFSEDPTEQNRLNVRHALKKAQSGMQLSDADSQLLIDNGLDDFVRGGQTQAAGIDAALLAAPFLAKPAMIGGALTGLGKVIKKYPGKSAEVAATALGGASEDPQDVAEFEQCKEDSKCYDDAKDDFPISMDMLSLINQGLIAGELNLISRTVSDTENDRMQDITSAPQAPAPSKK